MVPVMPMMPMMPMMPIVLAAAAPLSPPTDAEVAQVTTMVGAGHLPMELRWTESPRDPSFELADAIAALPTASRGYGPDAWTGSPETFVDAHGAAMTLFDAHRGDAFVALAAADGNAPLLARALLRDPSAVRPVLAEVHTPDPVDTGPGHCHLSDAFDRRLLEILTGLPFREAYPATPQRLAELRRVAREPLDVGAGRADHWAVLAQSKDCSTRRLARDTLAALARLEDIVAAASAIYVAEVRAVGPARPPHVDPDALTLDVLVIRSLVGARAPGETLGVEMALPHPDFPRDFASGHEAEVASARWRAEPAGTWILFEVASFGYQAAYSGGVVRIEPVAREAEIRAAIGRLAPLEEP